MHSKTRLPGPDDPASARFKYVLDVVFAGSRNKMATTLGCSPSLISRIVLGKQEPGANLLSALADQPSMNRLWVLLGEGEPFTEPKGNLPVAKLPLPGPLKDFEHLLTGRMEALESQLVKGDSTYLLPYNSRVKALTFEPSTGDGDVYAIIDSDVELWQGNVELLDGKTCAIRIKLPEATVVQLR